MAISLYTDVVYNVLFKSCSTVGRILNEGFMSLVKTVLHSSVSVGEKKLIMTQSFWDVSMKVMKAFFNASQSVTYQKFLKKVFLRLAFHLS